MTPTRLALTVCCLAFSLFAPGCIGSVAEAPEGPSAVMGLDGLALEDVPVGADLVGVDVALDVAASLPLAGELAVPTGSVSGRVSGASVSAPATCALESDTGGPEHVWALHLDDTSWVHLEAKSEARLVLAVRTASEDPDSELACERPGSAPSTSLDALLEPGDYFVLVGATAADAGGDYELSVDAQPLTAQASRSFGRV